MRKTSKIVSLLLTLVMILGIAVPMTVSADSLTFSDVPTTHNYHEAIMNLVAEGIVNGMGDGTYNPEGAVTREQFAKIICYALSVGELTYSPEEKNIFIDVAPDRWSSDNIKTAYKLGIINGMGDGTFAPENNVLYEQAVKMVVCALGYSPAHADREGGYPMGYMAIANRAGILKGLRDVRQGEPLNRGAVAKIVDNMRDANQISDGEETESLRDQTTEKSQKYEGRVIGLYGRSLYTGEDESEVNKYQIEIEKGSTRKIFVASDLDLDVETYLGRSVTVYYDSDDFEDYPSITNISLQSGKNKQVKIDFDLIRRYDSDNIEYYEGNKDGKLKEVDFLSDTKVVFNGQATESTLEEVIDENAENSGTVTLVYSSSSEKADVAFVKAYDTFIVNSIDLANYKVFYSTTGYYTLDVTDRSTNITITNAGKDYEFSRIKKNNVISIAESEDGKYIDVLVSTKTMAGTVEQDDGDSIVLDSASSTTLYKSSILPDAQDEYLEVGNYVTLYLDSFNKIAKVMLSEKGTFVFGYLSQIAVPERRNEKFQVMIHTPGAATIEGKVYDLADKVKIDNQTYDSVEDADEIESKLYIAAHVSGVNPDIDDPEGTDYSQPVKFIANNSNVIQAILTNKATSSSSVTRLDLEKYITGDGIECIADKTRLGTYKISSSTKVMFIPSNRENLSGYKTWTANNFKKGEFYYAQLAGVSNSTISMIYVYGTTSGSSSGAEGFTEDCKPMIVTDSRSVTVDGENVHRIRLTDVISGEENITVYESDYEETEEITTLEIGDIIRIAYEDEEDENGESKNYVTALQVLAVAADVVAGDVASDDIFYEDGTEEGITAEYRTVIGIVRIKEGNSLRIRPGVSSGSGETDETHTYVSTAKVYTIDTQYTGSDVVNEGVYDEITTSSKVLIFTESDTVKAIIIFRGEDEE